MKSFSKKRFSKGWFTGLVLGVASSAALVYAAAVNIPNTFTSGQTVSAAQMNANFAALENCPGNDANDAMVRVGALCVDKYEASVWDRADGTDGVGGGPQSGFQFGVPLGVDDYPVGCLDNGNGCAGVIFARSETDVVPSSRITWFQAQQACANSNKRLLTNAEWQMAAAGTPDVVDDNLLECNTSAAGGKVATGSRTNCRSVSHNTNDMVGNVWEWVGDWIQGDTDAWAPTSGADTAGANHGDDLMAGVNPATNAG